MLFFKGSGKVFLGIETVFKGNVRHWTVFRANSSDYLRNTAFAYVVGRSEADCFTEQPQKMKLGIACNACQHSVVKLVLQVRFDIVYNALDVRSSIFFLPLPL